MNQVRDLARRYWFHVLVAVLAIAAMLEVVLGRGDEEVVARHRATIAERAPDILPLWDALADATRALAANGKVPA